jgi:hypothetical protein
MASDPYGNISVSLDSDTNWVSSSSNAASLSNIQWNEPPRPSLEAIDLTAYTEDELKGFAGLLEVYINEKYPPKPPKFTSIEEADAWMEKHYGQ